MLDRVLLSILIVLTLSGSVEAGISSLRDQINSEIGEEVKISFEVYSSLPCNEKVSLSATDTIAPYISMAKVIYIDEGSSKKVELTAYSNTVVEESGTIFAIHQCLDYDLEESGNIIAIRDTLPVEIKFYEPSSTNYNSNSEDLTSDLDFSMMGGGAGGGGLSYISKIGDDIANSSGEISFSLTFPDYQMSSGTDDGNSKSLKLQDNKTNLDSNSSSNLNSSSNSEAIWPALRAKLETEHIIIAVGLIVVLIVSFVLWKY